MKPSSELFDLIKKLTPTEKRYFVLHSNLQQGTKGYLEMFWEIDKMDEYEEATLKERLKEKGIVFSQLHVIKNGLSKQILKSLRSFHERNNVQQKLFALMADASLLEGKGLFEQCLKKLRVGDKLAKENEYFRFQAEIQQKIIDISFRIGVKNPKEFLSTNYSTLSDIEKIANFNSKARRISHLSFAVSQLRGRVSSDELTEEIKNIRTYELPQIAPLVDSNFNSEKNFHFACSLLDLAEGKNPVKHQKNILSAWDKNPKIKENFKKEYKRDFANYLDACLFDSTTEDFESLLIKFKNIKDKDYISMAESAQHYFHLYLMFCLKSGQFEKAKELIPEIESYFIKHKAVIFSGRYLAISMNVFLVLFGFEKHSEAFDWLYRISEAKLKESRPDIQAFARVMELILHFEMENHYYVENTHSSVMRNLKNKRQWGEFERAVLLHVRKLTRAVDKKKRKEVFQKLFDKLMTIRTKNKGKRLTFLIEVAVWAKSRAEGITFFEAAKLLGG